MGFPAEVDGLTPLTTKQALVYGMLRNLMARSSHSPSYADIQGALGLGSIHSVWRYLKILEEKGYLVPNQGKARSIQLVEPLTQSIAETTLRIQGVALKSQCQWVPHSSARVTAIPKDLFRPAADFLIEAVGPTTGPTQALIRGDFLAICTKAWFTANELFAVKQGSKIRVGWGRLRGSQPWLIPDKKSPAIKLTSEFELLGRVVGMIRQASPKF